MLRFEPGREIGAAKIGATLHRSLSTRNYAKAVRQFAESHGIEKSAVRQDDFGQDWQVKLNIIPVIPALVKNPLF